MYRTNEESHFKFLKSNILEGSHEDEFLSSTGSNRIRPRAYSRWSPIDEGVTLAWSDLNVYVKTRNGIKKVINNATGAVKAGSMVALMGSSGAGKSTFMSALAYKNEGNTVVEGEILVNGRPLGPYMRYISGYMYQEDLFVSYLTVLEHMQIMAKLKLDRRIPKNDVNKKILDILKQLGLSKCIHSRIGNGSNGKCTLSGGERKRLAFATELLTDPPVLFCDEPTTGLDSYSAHKIIKMMNKMTSEGKTILCTIHQPSSDIFSMFGQMILLAEGRIAYMGSTGHALEFFENLGYACPTSYCPADFFIKTLSCIPGYENNNRTVIKRICDNFAVSDYAKEVDVVVQYEFHMGRAVVPRCFVIRKDFKESFWYSKLSCLVYRWFLDNARNPSLEISKLIQSIILAAIIGFCYLGTDPYTQEGIQAVQGILFVFVTENSFTPMYAVLGQFPGTATIFFREYSAALYHPLTYYLSKIISLIPGMIIQPVVFVLTAYWLTGLRWSASPFFMSMLIIILTRSVSSACGIMFVNAFESVPTSLAYLVPFDYVLMITSGLFIKLSTLPTLLYWTQYLSWLMYSTELLSIVQWQGVKNITCEDIKSGLPCLTDGSQVLERYSFSENHLTRDIINLMLLILLFYLIGFICLFRRVTKKLN